VLVGANAKETMAKKTVLVSDMSGQEIPEGKGEIGRAHV
jgi:hypothetical protein